MEFRIRVASAADADRIATAHLDSIRTLGLRYYDQHARSSRGRPAC